jgi:hypothetical protein
MLAALFNGVLPIFAISVIGYVCGRLKGLRFWLSHDFEQICNVHCCASFRVQSSFRKRAFLMCL